MYINDHKTTPLDGWGIDWNFMILTRF